MSDNNAKIDAIVRKERRNLLFSAVAFILFSFTFIFFTQPSAGRVSETTGLVKSFVSVPTDYGEKLNLVVELENGQLIRVYIDNLAMYQQGKVVNLLRQEPLFFGKTDYLFSGYKGAKN